MGLFTKVAMILMGVAVTNTVGQVFPIQSGPFTLRVSAPGNAVDGSFLYSCHSGAAIEQLCTDNATNYNGQFSTYYLNSSTNSIVNGEPAGALVWNMPFNSQDAPQYVSEPLTFAYDPTTNVAAMVFIPSSGYNNVPVGFDHESKLFLYSYVDQSVFPPNLTAGGPFTFYHWNVCKTYYSGYQYQALAWVTAGAAVNPSCVPVNVTREYIVL
jgi:hypothetical protein